MSEKLSGTFSREAVGVSETADAMQAAIDERRGSSFDRAEISLLAAGAGALVGAVLARMIAKHHADYLHDQLEKGGLLLWELAKTAEKKDRARDILAKHSAHGVLVHGLRV